MPELPNCVAIDTETTGLNAYRGARMFSAAAAFPDGKRMFWMDDFDEEFRNILADPKLDKIFHNAKFDLRMLEFGGFEVKGQVWDTMIFGHLLDGRDSQGRLSLDEQSKKYLPAEFRKVTGAVNDWFIENGHFKWKGKGSARHKVASPPHGEGFKALPVDILKQRVVGDANLTLRLFARMYSTVAGTFPQLLEMEHRLIPILMEMEGRGITVDLEGRMTPSI